MTAGYLLRIARLDLTLLWRNRTSLLTVIGLPSFFGVLLVVARDSGNKTAGLASALYVGTGEIAFFLVFAVFINLAGVLTARREDLILKRLRSGPLPDGAILGGIVLSATAVYAAMAGILMVVVSVVLGAGAPADPLLLLLALGAGVVVFALLGFAVAGITPTAELTQWTVVPMLFLCMAGSGFMFPLDDLPDGLQKAAAMVPLSPVVEIVRTAYLGQDYTYGGDRGDLSLLGAWAACGPAFLVLLAWAAVGAWLARRWFRWEPRRG